MISIDSNVKAPKEHKSAKQKDMEEKARKIGDEYRAAYRAVYGIPPLGFASYCDVRTGKIWFRCGQPNRVDAKRLKELTRQLKERGDKVR